ncbi:SAM-dependent methyltransferase [Agromyces sp. SYSU K20354]|uniref:SAM-dependent methyltransferase n=1 Tax=Agromyces cavernae TaxID=2898659 RepID=UPI001E614B76|nr:SAM-dependent methyltransferase [Agromyces cavernae]MCD2442115.1 SAM-dependent methyltransferase [Agromyces cavernae]
MDDCCAAPDTEGYDEVFDDRFARKTARRYRRKGLTPAEQRIVAFLSSTGLDDATVLEVGGGVGEIQLELLARGAARTVNLELSGAYETEAARLIDEAGVAGRITRRLGVDLAATPERVDVADIVVLHRVVCCYPDVEHLLGAAADRARRAIVFSHPPRTRVRRARVAVDNFMHRLSRKSYRGFVHEPAAMLDTLRRHGFEPRYRHTDRTWCIVGALRE